MGDRGLQKLKRRELLKMLLVQCEEAERLQQEMDVINDRFQEMEESYVRLKKKLDVKDERLNQKDATILQLRQEIERTKKEKNQEIERMKEEREAEQEKLGSAADIFVHLNEILGNAQREVLQYLGAVQRLKEQAEGKPLTKSANIQAMPQKKNMSDIGRAIKAVGGEYDR